MKEILIKYTGRKILVDDEDYERINQFNWTDGGTIRRYFSVKRKIKEGYAFNINASRTTIAYVSIANEVMQCFDGQMFDHIDRDPANNQKLNLRLCTHQQNGMNRTKQKNVSSKYMGVSWHKTISKWIARIKKNGKLFHLGYFLKEEDAARAYNNAAKELFGEFANINNL